MEDCLEKLERDNNVEWSIGLSLLREFEPSLLLSGSGEDCDFFSNLAQHIGEEEAATRHSIDDSMPHFQDDMDLSNQAFQLSDESKTPQGKYMMNYEGLTAESETSSRCSERFAQYCRTFPPALTKEDLKTGEANAYVDSRRGHELRTTGVVAAEKKPRTAGGAVPGTRRKASHHARTILMDWIYIHRGRSYDVGYSIYERTSVSD